MSARELDQTRLGRMRPASRRAGVAVGAVAGVALVGGLLVWAGVRGRGPDAASASVPLVVPGDAVDAVAGRDYDVVATLRGADAEQAVALAPDGAVLLVRYAAHDYARPTYTLLDPHTGRRTPVVVAPGLARVAAVTTDAVVTSSVVDGRLVVVWFDRASGGSVRRTLPRVPALPGARPIPIIGVTGTRTVWFLTHRNRGEGGGSTRTQLWEAPEAGRPRLVARITDFAVTADAVAWTAPVEHASGTVHVRALADGATSTFTLPRCTAGSTSAALDSVWGAGDLLALQAICPHAPYDRTFLARTDGTVVADLVINEEAQPTSLGDRALVFPSYAWDEAHRHLLRLDHSHYEHSPWPQTAGDLVAWRLGTGEEGGPLRVARLR
jgi:hypothetical protein